MMDNNNKKCGYLYVAMGKRYLREAGISAKSLKRFTKYPICLVTDDSGFQSEYIDKVILCNTAAGFITKIIGIQKTPFFRTIFLDSDTFVCSSIDHLFEVLDIFDMSMTVENLMHTYGFIEGNNPEFKMKYYKVIPEYNTGVIIFKSTESVKKLMYDWLIIHKLMNVSADMPSFREAMLENVESVRISPLPFEYNYHGTHSFGFAYNEIKIIHERLGERFNTLTTVMLPFEKMDRKAKHMNKFKGKRIIVPYFGIIRYTLNPFNIKRKIKSFFGIKRIKKSELIS